MPSGVPDGIPGIPGGGGGQQQRRLPYPSILGKHLGPLLGIPMGTLVRALSA
ncbi:MAG TPA: hypothetical protein VHT73_13875 [Thermodesulfobacteriota bacterium]|nr:hypothetical protein [Thermodesulfobacteriota bacterium]